MRRITCWSLGLGCAVWSAHDSAVAYYSGTPGKVPAMLQNEPTIFLVEQNWALLGPGKPDRGIATNIETAARNALRTSPLGARPLRQMALARAAVGLTSSEHLALAQHVSRRDSGTQLELLRRATQAGDYERSLHHLDVLLTIVPDAGAEIYPAMAELVTAPDFRSALVRRTQRPWFKAFVVSAATSGDPIAVAQLLTGVRLKWAPEETLAPLVTRLIERGRMDLARRVAISVGAASARGLDAFGFSEETTAPQFAPLTWRLFGDGAATWEVGDRGAEITVEAGRTAITAERVTALKPGSYTLTQVLSGDGAVAAEWQMWCGFKADAGAPLWRVRWKPGQAASYHDRFTVPSGCSIQRWQLSATADDGFTPARFQIGAVELR